MIEETKTGHIRRKLAPLLRLLAFLFFSYAAIDGMVHESFRFKKGGGRIDKKTDPSMYKFKIGFCVVMALLMAGSGITSLKKARK